MLQISNSAKGHIVKNILSTLFLCYPAPLFRSSQCYFLCCVVYSQHNSQRTIFLKPQPDNTIPLLKTFQCLSVHSNCLYVSSLTSYGAIFSLAHSDLVTLTLLLFLKDTRHGVLTLRLLHWLFPLLGIL